MLRLGHNLVGVGGLVLMSSCLLSCFSVSLLVSKNCHYLFMTFREYVDCELERKVCNTGGGVCDL